MPILSEFLSQLGHRLPAASRFALEAVPAARMATDTSKEARHAMILRLVNHSGQVPPCRVMARRLSEIGFHSAGGLHHYRQLDSIIRRIHQILLRAEVSLGRLDRSVPEQ